jgi:hypothetical protein
MNERMIATIAWRMTSSISLSLQHLARRLAAENGAV